MVEWRISDHLVDYREAERQQEVRVAEISAETAPELVWLLEHPPLYTAGTSATSGDLLKPDQLPVYETKRGGEYTYHGPGQRVGYVMLDLNQRGRDVRLLVWRLEEWVIRALAEFNVDGERRSGRVGVWVRRIDKGAPEREDKVAALGVRLRRWVSFHGVSINVDPDLSHYDGIVPCGISGQASGYGVTSLLDLGVTATLADVDLALQTTFDAALNATPQGGPS
ncbi:MAG: lipoyl(octanoyl) transferase LipB [Rhodobacteraceae bacterium]|nr:lipoyl(octanoyl) transferase LipB [Paracoccaceae bacterium]